MALLACSNIKYTIGTRVLLDGIGLSIDAGERIGLVGRNGCGKSTLLKILAGRIKPDSGTAAQAKSVRIGYLTQDPELDMTKTLQQEAGAGFVELAKVHAELDDVYHQMAEPENAAPEKMQRLLDKQSDLQHRIEELGGYATDHKVEAVLHGLGFTDAQFGLQVSKLSGGQKGRLALAKLLLESPELLLLDEPTNHLDIAGREWLEEFLVHEFTGAVIIISHDRYMLDRVVQRIEEIENGRMYDYPGNYTAFLEIRKQRHLTQQRAYENQQSQWAKEEEFIRRFKAGQRAKEAQGRLSKLERQKELFAIDRVAELSTMRFNFPQGPRSGDHVVTVRDASKSYIADGQVHRNEGDEDEDTLAPGEAPAVKVLFKDLNVTISRGEHWAIIGPNGAGKSTLIKAILGQIPLDAGKTVIGASVFPGYYAQMPPEEDGDLKVYEYLQKIIKRENPASTFSEQAARDLAGIFLFSGEDQEKPIGVMSGGERSRARIAGLLASAKNLLIMDEPTNHLDIPSAERLEQALMPNEENGGFTGTLLLISHDRAIIDATCHHLIVLDGHGNATVFHGTYSEWHAKQQSLAQQKKREDEEAAKRKTAQQEKAKAAAQAKAEAKAEAKPAPSAPVSKPSTNGAASSGSKLKKSAYSWMAQERLEAEIATVSARVKETGDLLAQEEVYRDAKRFQALLKEQETQSAELAKLEEEWLRRAEA
jgi:ATP-binding cassette subfamily F protein 3